MSFIVRPLLTTSECHMRWTLGSPPIDTSFDPHKHGWTRLKLPSPYLLLAMGIPVSILTALLLALGWREIVPPTFHMTSPFAGFGLQAPLIFLLLLLPAALLVIFIHELLHCAGHPGMGFSSASYIGAWPSRLMFYSVYLGDIMRNRYLVLGLLPFLVLSVVPLFLCFALDTSPGLHTVILAFVSIANGVCCCNDLLIVLIICWRVPNNATIHDQGWEMYWKLTAGRAHFEPLTV